MGGSSSKRASAEPARKVVVAVDESNVSLDTLKWAAKRVLTPNDELHLITVLDSVHTQQINYTENAPTPDKGRTTYDAESGALEYSQRFLESIRDRVLQEHKVSLAGVKLQPLVSCIGSSQDVGRAIGEYIRKEGCDVCVVGSRGLGQFRRAMLGMLGLGSVSQSVLRHAPCPVMIYKTPTRPPASRLSRLITRGLGMCTLRYSPAQYGAVQNILLGAAPQG